jgi:hypothetical protein
MARSLYWQVFKVFYRFQGFGKLQSQKNKNEFWNSTSIPLISMDFVTLCYWTLLSERGFSGLKGCPYAFGRRQVAPTCPLAEAPF